MVFSPLMVILTGPEGANFSLTKSNKPTSNKIKIKNAITVMRITPKVLEANIILLFYFIIVFNDTVVFGRGIQCCASFNGFFFVTATRKHTTKTHKTDGH